MSTTAEDTLTSPGGFDGFMAGLAELIEAASTGQPDPAKLAALPKIACPTLVVRGAESEMYESDQAEEVARAIPAARAMHIPGAGHWVPLDNPNGLLGPVREFLSAGAP